MPERSEQLMVIQAFKCLQCKDTVDFEVQGVNLDTDHGLAIFKGCCPMCQAPYTVEASVKIEGAKIMMDAIEWSRYLESLEEGEEQS